MLTRLGVFPLQIIFDVAGFSFGTLDHLFGKGATLPVARFPEYEVTDNFLVDYQWHL